MVKKRDWKQNEQNVAAKKPVKVCAKTWQPCEHKEKIAVSKEALEDGRITRNELIKELTEVKDLLVLKKARIADLELKVHEQDNIINDMFDDLVEYSDTISGIKLSRNIAIAIDVILIILLILCL